jgi:predicted transcriptional regulator
MTDTDAITDQSDADLLALTADIVVAFLANNRVEAEAVPQVISATHAALARLGTPGADAPVEVEEIQKPSRAAERKSVTDDGIVSFLDGRTYKTLKRHLSTRGYTPDSYRERFGLSADYPMVAPAYSAVRSAHAKASGLGTRARLSAKAMKAAGKHRT